MIPTGTSLYWNFYRGGGGEGETTYYILSYNDSGLDLLAPSRVSIALLIP